MKKTCFVFLALAVSGLAQAGYQFGLSDVKILKNLDADDGLCSTKKSVEVNFDFYSLSAKGLRSPEHRVYGTARISQFGKSLQLSSLKPDWNLSQKRNLIVAANGDFEIHAEIVDQDYCGIGMSWLGGVVVNSDKVIVSKTIQGNINQLQFVKKGPKKCEARVAISEKDSHAPVDGHLLITSDCN